MFKEGIMELQEAITKRRSIRKFTNYYVTDDEIITLLEAARWAPSWANTQAWTFIIARDRNVIEKMSATLSKSNPATECMAKASAVIVACAREGRDVTKFNSWYMFDLGLAVQNVCLKAHEIGLGTVIAGLLDHEKCRAVLSVPEDFEVVVLIPVGKPVEQREGPKRKAINTMSFLNKFGEPFIK